MDSSSPLHFSTHGDSNAPALVLLHGGGVSGWMWKPVISHLGGFRVFAVDLPEQGESVDVGPFSMKLAAQKVAELIRANTPNGRAHVAGLSAGAQTLVQLLADFPEVVDHALVSSALMLPVPGLGWMNSPSLFAWAYQSSIAPFKNWDWWMRINMKYSAGLGDEFFPDFKRDFQAMTQSGFVNLMIANQIFRMPAGLEKVTVPTLAICGHKEYRAMQDSMRALANVMPHARAMQLNLGKNTTMAQEHNWAVTAPELFARTLQAWIRNETLPAELKPLG